VPNAFFTMLFFTADWWDSFDDDALSSIASTCCGDYVDGDPVVAESVQHCQASYWIINQLVDIFNSAADALNTVYTDLNPFYNDKSDIYNTLHADFEISEKAKERMTSYPAFINALTEIFYSQTVIGTSLIIDPGFAALAAYIESEKATLTAGLRAEDNETDAFTYLYSTLVIWIDANIPNTQTATWVKQALAATITPQLGDNFLNVLFSQDADLIGYAGAECMAIEASWDFDADAEGWVFAQLAGTANGAWSANEGGALQIELPSGSSGQGAWSLDVLAEGWVASSTTQLTAYIKGTTCASGDRAEIIYSDDTFDRVQIVTGVDVTLVIPASPGNFGKTIKSLQVDTNKGPNCSGNTLIHYVTSVEFIL